MTATALYTLIAGAAVLGGYALYRRETDHHPHAATGFATGWDHTTVDYQNSADAVTDQRYERNFFMRPYEIFCPGGEIRPYEIDAHGQPTGRQLVMPGESPTVGDPSEYVMVGFHPAHGFGHSFHLHHFGNQFALQQAALAEAEAEAEAAALTDPTLADPMSMAAMGDFMTGLTPAQLSAIHMRSLRRLGLGGGGYGQHNMLQQQLQQQLLQQQLQLQQLQQQVAEQQAAQQLADTQAQTDLLATQAAATTGDYATGAINPYALAMLRRRMMGGGGWRQQQLQQQLLQQQLLQQQLEAQLAQQQADLLAAQQLDPGAAGLGAAAGV